MSEIMTLKQIDQAAEFIRARISHKPGIGLILGSGLGGLASAVKDAEAIPFSEIPNWPQSTVLGHQGKLVCGLLEKQPVVVMQGRVHYYEGYEMDQVGLPVRVMQRLGVHTLIVTNAAGAINPAYQPGDLMLILDHIKLDRNGGFEPTAWSQFRRIWTPLSGYEPGV